MRRTCFIAATVVLSLASWVVPPPARADVAASGPGGFVLKIENTLAAEPEKVFDKVLQIGDWWNGAHTYSGSAGNLRIENQPGGCFCERLADGGFVRHGTVEFSSRGKVLRLAGALGPLQGMGAYGLMAFTFQKADGGTKLVVTYTVSGFAPGKGYEELAGVVNQVLTEQFSRLKQSVDTGKPLPPKPEAKN
jgi:hypothetical protein